MSGVYPELTHLLVYRNLLQDDLVKDLLALDAAEAGISEYDLAAKLIKWAEDTGLAGNIPENYLLYLIGYGENVFSTAAEKTNSQIGDGLLQAAAHDITILKRIFKNGLSSIFSDTIGKITHDYHPTGRTSQAQTAHIQNIATLRDNFFDITTTYTPEQVVGNLGVHYKCFGYGKIAGYVAFKWDCDQRNITGVRHSDPVKLADIVGYEYQKEELIRNTEAFVTGRPANNVLLVGARGTGKSSSIKAIANKYFDQGLRIIEVTKSDFRQLPEIMTALRRWGKKFILFLDDLSFEEFEVEYKLLKSLIDGGMEVKPNNVLIYATSNRRHLIKETWDDRSGNEVHRQDTVNEKISLSDRFGITLFYTSPNQDEYFTIVEELARKCNIAMTSAELRKEALKWEMAHSGRSGRSAQQLITYLAGDISS